MARLVHLSDLHFGAHDPAIVTAVEREVDAIAPDLVIVSGDFTQRARTEEFQEACRFLGRLRDAGHEVLGIPGNHDVPLYDVLRRFLSPLTRYRRYIDDELCPAFGLPGAAILGVNTARSSTFKDGRISRDQIDMIRDHFARTAAGSIKILVTHHPLFALPIDESGEFGEAVGRQELALDAVADLGVDLLLAGHNHRASTHHARDLVTRAGGALVIQAGTATSVRTRDEKQSFNVLDVDAEAISVALKRWSGTAFDSGEPTRFRRAEGGWEMTSQAEADATAPA